LRWADAKAARALSISYTLAPLFVFLNLIYGTVLSIARPEFSRSL